MTLAEKRRKKLEPIADLCFAQYNNFEKKTQWEAMMDALGMAYDAALEEAAQVVPRVGVCVCAHCTEAQAAIRALMERHG